MMSLENPLDWRLWKGYKLRIQTTNGSIIEGVCVFWGRNEVYIGEQEDWENSQSAKHIIQRGNIAQITRLDDPERSQK